jgi:hypothetical protein
MDTKHVSLQNTVQLATHGLLDGLWYLDKYLAIGYIQGGQGIVLRKHLTDPVHRMSGDEHSQELHSRLFSPLAALGSERVVAKEELLQARIALQRLHQSLAADVSDSVLSQTQQLQCLHRTTQCITS